MQKRKLKTSVLSWSPGPALDLPCELVWVPLPLNTLPLSTVSLSDEEFSAGVSAYVMVGYGDALTPPLPSGHFHFFFQATWFSVPHPRIQGLPSSVLSTSLKALILPPWCPGNRLFTGWQRQGRPLHPALGLGTLGVGGWVTAMGQD